MTMKYLICSIILQSFQFEPEHKKKKRVVKAMRKKLNLFILGLLIHYILE